MGVPIPSWGSVCLREISLDHEELHVAAVVRVTRVADLDVEGRRAQWVWTKVVRIWKGRRTVSAANPVAVFANLGGKLRAGDIRFVSIGYRKWQKDYAWFTGPCAVREDVEWLELHLGRGWHPENGRWVEDGCASCFWYE